MKKTTLEHLQNQPNWLLEVWDHNVKEIRRLEKDVKSK